MSAPRVTDEQALVAFRRVAAVGRKCLEIDSAPLDARIAVGRALLALKADLRIVAEQNRQGSERDAEVCDSLRMRAERAEADGKAANMSHLEEIERRTKAEARVTELEDKALAYDDAHRGDFHDRAHRLAQQDGADAGRNVWHIAVERAEKAEARIRALEEMIERYAEGKLDG